MPRGSVGSGRHWRRANTAAQRLTRGAAAERRGLLGLVVAALVWIRAQGVRRGRLKGRGRDLGLRDGQGNHGEDRGRDSGGR